MTNRFRNVFTQEIWGSSPKSKNLNILKKKTKTKNRETHKKCYINPTYIFRIFCIKDNDNQ